jgi:hypothetical protein
MSYSRVETYQPKQFRPGQVVEAISTLLPEFGIDPAAATITFTDKLPDGTSSTSTVELGALNVLCEFSAGRSVTFTPGSLSATPSLGIMNRGGALYVVIEAGDASMLNRTHTMLRDSLALEPPKREPEYSGPTLVERVKRLEEEVVGLQAHAATREAIRCFLSARFDKASEPYVLKVQRFLSLIGIEVVTGHSYEPRKVSDKVLGRLALPHDFMVLLIAESGQSTWTRDEIAFAFGRSIPVIPLVEEGARFEAGLFADLEYIEFPAGCVGEAFIKLLEAVRYIESQRPNTLA